jgi:hypothetical protein
VMPASTLGETVVVWLTLTINRVNCSLTIIFELRSQGFMLGNPYKN